MLRLGCLPEGCAARHRGPALRCSKLSFHQSVTAGCKWAIWTWSKGTSSFHAPSSRIQVATSTCFQPWVPGARMRGGCGTEPTATQSLGRRKSWKTSRGLCSAPRWPVQGGAGFQTLRATRKHRAEPTCLGARESAAESARIIIPAGTVG